MGSFFRSLFKFFLRLLAVVLVAMGLFSAVVAARFAAGPVNMAFLVPLLEETVNRDDSTFRIEVGDIFLIWAGWDRAFNILARDVRLMPRRFGDTPLAVFPKIAGGLAVEALLRGEVAPAWLELSQPQIVLRRSADGQVTFALGAENGSPIVTNSGSPLMAGALAAFQYPPNRMKGPLEYLKRVGISKADILFEDQATGVIWKSPEMSVSLSRDNYGLEVTLEGRAGTATGQAEISAVAFKPFTADVIQATVNSPHFEPILLSGLLPGGGALSNVADRLSPLAIKGEATFNLAGLPLDWSLESVSDIGTVLMQGHLNPDEEAIDKGLLPFENVLTLQAVRAEQLLPLLSMPAILEGPLEGKINMRGRWNNRIQQIQVPLVETDLTGADGHFTLPDIYAEPLSHNGLTLTGRAEENGQVLVLDRLAVKLPHANAIFEGNVRQAKQGQNVTFNGRLSSFDMRHLPQYWPKGLGEEARKWVLENIPTGSIPTATMHLSGRLGGDKPDEFTLSDMGGKILLEEGTVHYFRPFPPATNVKATATYGRDWFNIDIGSGQAGTLQSTGGSIKIADVGNKNNFDITINGQAPFREVLELLDQKPFQYASDLGINPQDVQGRIKGQVQFKFPLETADLKLSQVRTKSDAVLTGLVLEDAFQDFPVTARTAKLHVDNSGFNLKGDINLGSLTLAAVWRQNFDKDVAPQGKLSLRGPVTDGALRDLGFAIPPWFAGEAAITVENSMVGSGDQNMLVNVDMKDSTLSLPLLNWQKPPSEPAHLSFALHTQPGGPAQFSPIHFAADGLKMWLSATLSEDFKQLEKVEFSKIIANTAVLSDSRILRTPTGEYVATFKGQHFDTTHLLDLLSHPASAEGPAWLDVPMLVEVEFRNLVTGDSLWVENAEAKIRYDNERIEFLNITARADDGSHMRVRYAPAEAGGGHVLEAGAGNAGAALRGTGLTNQVRGGILALKGHKRRPDLPMTGIILLKDYRVVDAPAMAKLLNFLGLTGALDALVQDGLAFTQFEGDFQFQDGILTLQNARTASPSLGLTLSGLYDLRRDHIEASGTIAPAYILNQGVNFTLNQIPLVGKLLTGGENNGIIGANYTVTGSKDDPEVNVNPLSVLTPGVLRRIFEVSPEE